MEADTPMTVMSARILPTKTSLATLSPVLRALPTHVIVELVAAAERTVAALRGMKAIQLDMWNAK